MSYHVESDESYSDSDSYSETTEEEIQEHNVIQRNIRFLEGLQQQYTALVEEEGELEYKISRGSKKAKEKYGELLSRLEDIYREIIRYLDIIRGQQGRPSLEWRSKGKGNELYDPETGIAVDMNNPITGIDWPRPKGGFAKKLCVSRR